MNELYYKGTPLEEMPKEDLIEAIKELNDLYMKSISDHTNELEAIRYIPVVFSYDKKR